MPLAREQRKLAAIVAADVVGYSRLMGRDESGTLARLRKNRSDHLNPILAKYGGRLVKLTGDGALLEFASAVNALSAAIEFQQATAEANADQPADAGLVFRMGLHLGDLIVDGDDLYGDGVNVAARLESEAPPGGILISRNVHDAVAGRVKATFEDRGSLALKNIERPVQAFSVKWEPSDWQLAVTAEVTVAPATAAVPLPLPEKPSLAVLPFLCPGGSPEYEAFSDGITESLITDLSRQTGLAVVARTTSFALKGKAMDVREVGRTLGARYILEGSVQAGAHRLRVNVQLISARTGIHLWADRFDRELGDLLDLQDEIAERISRALAVQLREAEIRRAAEQHEGAPNAETLVLLGRRALMEGFCRKNTVRAAALYEQALMVDDRNIFAHTALSIAKSMLYIMRWSDTRDAELDAAIQHRDDALSLDPSSPFAQVASAWILSAERKFSAALATFERIAQAAPVAGGNAFANLALTKNFVGRAAEAESELLRVIRVTPSDPQIDVWYYNLGITYLYLGRYEDAVEALQQAISRTPDLDVSHILLAAAQVQLGRLHEARTAIRQAQSLGTNWTVHTIKATLGYDTSLAIDNAHMTTLWDGLRQVGMPE
jgi:TolB-like protein/class 3 adenylate cyclase/Flp pilus assembly protein TadD